MKALVLTAILFASNLALAEECVSAKNRKYGFEPKSICIQEIKSVGDGLIANVKGTPYSANFESLGVDDNGIEVLVATVVRQPDDVGCGHHMIQTLTLWVKTEVAAKADEKRLQKALLGYEYTPDTCHSEVERNLVQYE